MDVRPGDSGSPIILHYEGRVYELIDGDMYRDEDDKVIEVGGVWADITNPPDKTPSVPGVYVTAPGPWYDPFEAAVRDGVRFTEPWIPDLTEDEVKECCALLEGTEITLKYEGVMRDILVDRPWDGPRMPVSGAPQPRYGWRG